MRYAYLWKSSERKIRAKETRITIVEDEKQAEIIFESTQNGVQIISQSVKREGQSYEVTTFFYMYPNDVHHLKITRFEDYCELEGSVVTIGEMTGKAFYTEEESDFDKMLEEIKVYERKPVVKRTKEETEKLVDQLLGQMTLEEKAGQLSQSVIGLTLMIGNETEMPVPVNEMIEKGMLGSVAALSTIPAIYEAQKIAVEKSRLGIPLMFCRDCLHGAETIFPIPLAMSGSFEPELIKSACRIAAKEITADGVNYLFSPMLDIARDPRWGRVAEGSGEDPYLASVMAKAQVEGYQGEDLANADTVLACAKHFLGYGAVEGGRDYNTVEISENTMRNIYLPPFKAAVEAGVGSFMTAFNVMNGIPVVINRRIANDLLREEIGFDGVTICDFNAVDEAVEHGAAADIEEAVHKAMMATVDIHMISGAYYNYLPKLVKSGKLDVSLVDEAVRRVLRAKYRLGIMDDPFLYFRPERRKEVFSQSFLEESRRIAARSIVLLKNENVLPLSKEKKIALIGPIGNSKDLLGPWSMSNYVNETTTIKAGLEKQGYQVTFAKGCDLEKEIPGGYEEALACAQKADVILLSLGEASSDSGEASSRQNIHLPKVQQRLAKKIKKLGKPTVLILTNGRPLILDWFANKMDSILETWFLGSAAGDAIADVVSGKVSPSAKLPISFPRNEGQIPVYYNHLNTGRPYQGDDSDKFRSRYLDGVNTPLYPFGYGLSYTEFKLEHFMQKQETMKKDTVLELSVDIRNVGETAGEEIVQMYLRDMAASISRPVKELKAFQKVYLESGEGKTITFKINEEMLKFYNADGIYCSEPGVFEVMVGTSSADPNMLCGKFMLEI